MFWLHCGQLLIIMVFTFWRYRLKSLKGYCDELCKEFDPLYSDSQSEYQYHKLSKFDQEKSSKKQQPQNIDQIARSLNMVRERPVKRSKNRRENQAAQQDMAQRRL